MSYFSLFQSPHPVRGATGSRSCWPPSQCHFNPRTPRGVRLAPHAGGGAAILISIHAPREGCDRMFTRYLHGRRISIHAPREGCDQARSFQRRQKSRVSIHAPREGCDYPTSPRRISCTGFNPRTPRGVRLMQSALTAAETAVSIHAPREGCDSSTSNSSRARMAVSIHAPREGCDEQRAEADKHIQEFQSTHPARGATSAS